jgi:TRAP-type transport system periplasmic protein
VNSSGIYAALEDGTVDAQENPLAYMESFKHYEVMKYLSITNHMWSGFNMLAHLPTWNRLPTDIQAVIERNVTTYVRLQRQDQETANSAARTSLARHLAVNEVDMAPFRASMSSVYARWKSTFGAKCWSLLEAEAGRLA